MRPVLALTAVCLFILSSVSGEQQTAPRRQQYSETVDISIVNVDVVVTDSKGRRVHGLTRDDFEIYENKRPQPITHFAEYREEGSKVEASSESNRSAGTAAPPAPASSVESTAVVQKRAIVLFIERTRLPHARATELFGQLKELVRSTMRPGDLATVVTWDNGLMLVRQAATTDPEALSRVIDRLALESESPLIDPYLSQLQDAATTEAYLADARDFYKTFGGSDTSKLNDIKDDYTVWQRNVEQKTEDKLRAVSALVRSMGDVDARRILIFATRRFPIIGTTPHDQQRNSSRIAKLLAELTEAGNANGVTIYPFVAEETSLAPEVTDDARERSTGLKKELFENSGPSAGPAAAVEPLTQQERGLLDDVARGTGGIMTANAAESASRIASVAEDLASYYSLAYRATSVKGARTIVVKTKRPGLTVRSRTSYIVKTDDVRMEDRVVGLLFGVAPKTSFPIEASLRMSEGSGKGVRLLEVHIPIAAMTPIAEPGGYAFRFTVYIAGTGLKGVTQPFRYTKSFSVPASDLQRAKASFYTYEARININPSSRGIAIGVVDEVSKEYGVSTFDLDAADFFGKSRP